MNVAVTSVSTKGQIVIPGGIRHEMKIKAGAKLMVFTDGINLLMKPINPPDSRMFEDLVGESRKFAKKAGFKSIDVGSIIKKVRHESGR